jgi:hypothetical protein
MCVYQGALALDEIQAQALGDAAVAVRPVWKPG